MSGMKELLCLLKREEEEKKSSDSGSKRTPESMKQVLFIHIFLSFKVSMIVCFSWTRTLFLFIFAKLPNRMIQY